MGSTPSKRIELTPDPEWVDALWSELTPSKDLVVTHVYFAQMAKGDLPIDRFRNLLVNWYPLVESFPMYLAMNLAKLARYSGPGREVLRNWLIQNIAVEQAHAGWWIDWADGFGVTKDQLDSTRPCPEVQSLQAYLEVMCDRGQVFESLAAANIAMEWPTGEWTRAVAPGVRTYGGQGLAEINTRTMRWLTEHATYDDKHPFEAMELIKQTVTSMGDRERAGQAAVQGLELFHRGLTATFELR